MPDKLISIQDLTVTFSVEQEMVTAVDNISLDIPRGSITGIVGESGSGKSVTALSLMRLVQSPGRIAGGRILYESSQQAPVDILQLAPRQMQDWRGNEIAMIFQEPMTSLNPFIPAVGRWRKPSGGTKKSPGQLPDSKLLIFSGR